VTWVSGRHQILDENRIYFECVPAASLSNTKIRTFSDLEADNPIQTVDIYICVYIYTYIYMYVYIYMHTMIYKIPLVRAAAKGTIPMLSFSIGVQKQDKGRQLNIGPHNSPQPPRIRSFTLQKIAPNTLSSWCCRWAHIKTPISQGCSFLTMVLRHCFDLSKSWSLVHGVSLVFKVPRNSKSITPYGWAL